MEKELVPKVLRHVVGCHVAELSLCVMCAGMDNVRNMTGSPIAGIDPHEFIDSRPLCKGTGPPFPGACVLFPSSAESLIHSDELSAHQQQQATLFY